MKELRTYNVYVQLCNGNVAFVWSLSSKSEMLVIYSVIQKKAGPAHIFAFVCETP